MKNSTFLNEQRKKSCKPSFLYRQSSIYDKNFKLMLLQEEKFIASRTKPKADNSSQKVNEILHPDSAA